MFRIHESLTACYEDYIKDSAEIQAKTKAFDGMLGFHSKSKDHPCHMAFFEEVQELCGQLANDPEVTDVYSEVELVLFYAKGREKQLCYWYLLAAQQHAELLFPKLTPAQAKELLERYSQEYSKKDWLPAHVKLVKALKKRAKAKA